MSLRDLVDRKTQVDGGGGVSFEVRGLSLEDLVVLLEDHKEALVTIFASPEGTDFEELLQRFPRFISAAIAFAADEPELVEQVNKLPIGIQLRAIEAVWELSSLDIEALGKLATSLTDGLGKLNSDEFSILTKDLTSGSTPLPQAQSS